MATNPRETIAPQPAANAPQEVSFAVTGMTCASCAARVEKKLNKIDGVSATVNYATERARVTFTGEHPPPDLVDTLIAQVEATGYSAERPGTANIVGEGASATRAGSNIRRGKLEATRYPVSRRFSGGGSPTARASATS